MDIIQKTKDDYNKIADLYAATRSTAGELVQFKPLIAAGQYILDWGCGNARLLYLLENTDVRYVGTDISSKQIDIAKQVFTTEVASGKAEFFCTEHGEKIFPDKSFDRIFLLASLHHLPDTESRARLLATLRTELKDDGILIITVWNLESDWAKEKAKQDWKKLSDNDFLIPWKDKEGSVLVERYYHHFSEEELAQLLTECGFIIEKMYFAARDTSTDKRGGKNLVAVAKKQESKKTKNQTRV